MLLAMRHNCATSLRYTLNRRVYFGHDWKYHADDAQPAISFTCHMCKFDTVTYRYSFIRDWDYFVAKRYLYRSKWLHSRTSHVLVPAQPLRPLQKASAPLTAMLAWFIFDSVFDITISIPVPPFQLISISSWHSAATEHAEIYRCYACLFELYRRHWAEISRDFFIDYDNATRDIIYLGGDSAWFTLLCDLRHSISLTTTQ